MYGGFREVQYRFTGAAYGRTEYVLEGKVSEKSPDLSFGHCKVGIIGKAQLTACCVGVTIDLRRVQWRLPPFI